MLSGLKSFKKPLLLMVAAFVVLLVVLWGRPGLLDLADTSGSDEITLHPGLSFLVETDQGLKTRVVGPAIKEEPLLRQSGYHYTILNRNQEIGQVTLTCQDLPNGDVLFFVESQGATTESHSYQGRLTLSDHFPTMGRTLLYPEGELIPGQSIWQTISSKHLTSNLPKGIIFLDGQDNWLVLGPVDQLKDMGHGVFKEIRTMQVSGRRSQGKSEFLFPLSSAQGGMTRFWGVISNEPLVNWENKTDVSSIQMADLNRARKFWLDGTYDMVPFSYVPSDPRGFWRCPAQHVGRSFVTKGSRFTYAIAVSSMYASINTQNDAGYWPTEPQSTWLAEDYGFGHDFYDTRFNTDVARYLLESFHAYGEDKALDSARHYADFLCNFAQKSSYRSKNGGYLVPDYRDSSGEYQTHTSLNHLLAEMNFLYEMYLTTGNGEYKETAEKLRQAVKDTRDEWIKESGELWYSRLPNGDYGFEDYPTLTLNDLRQSQKLIAQIYDQSDSDLARLITSKEAYNRANGIPLW